MNLQKSVLWFGIAVLCCSALFVSFVILFGKFGDFESKLLITTLCLGAYALFAYASAGLSLPRGYERLAAIPGVGVAVAGCFFSLYVVWGYDSWGNEEGFAPRMKIALLFFIASFSLAHLSLLTKAFGRAVWGNVVVAVTALCIIAVGWMLAHYVYVLFDELEGLSLFYFRLLAVFAIFDFTGTAVAFMAKILALKKPTGSNTNRAEGK